MPINALSALTAPKEGLSTSSGLVLRPARQSMRGRLAGAGGADQRRQDARSEGARAAAQQLQHLLAVAVSDARHGRWIIRHALRRPRRMLVSVAFMYQLCGSG